MTSMKSQELGQCFDHTGIGDLITQEDIRRSGASRLAEALRLASNLQFAQVNAHDWAVPAYFTLMRE